MTTKPISITETPALAETEFQTGQVVPVITAHIAHDIYTASVAPLLPVLIEKLSLSLTQAGLLTTFLQIPGILNPYFGYLADKISFRYFLVLAPAMTATLIGSIGFTSNYAMLAILLLFAGVSNSAFHAPAPALVGRFSGRRIGLGMSLFMAAGETAYAIGPLLAVWVVSTWTLEGFWRIAIFGWAASLMLFFRLPRVSAQVEKPGSLKEILPELPALFVPLAIFTVLRYPLMESLATYLPTFMSMKGSSLYLAGASLSIYMISGVVGVLLVGPLSDRLGRKPVLTAVTVLSAVVALLFLKTSGMTALAVLVVLGFVSLCSTPVLLAMVQERYPKNRAMANGIYMMLNFALRPIGTISIGFLGDRFGLEKAMTWGALLSLFAVLAVWRIPEQKTEPFILQEN